MSDPLSTETWALAADLVDTIRQWMFQNNRTVHEGIAAISAAAQFILSSASDPDFGIATEQELLAASRGGIQLGQMAWSNDRASVELLARAWLQAAQEAGGEDG